MGFDRVRGELDLAALIARTGIMFAVPGWQP